MKANILATGPGGVLVFTPDGPHLGTTAMGIPTANDQISRIHLTTREKVIDQSGSRRL